MARWTADGGWEPGKLYEHQGATLDLSPGASVLHYGQSVFEGLKARRTRDGTIVLFRPLDNGRRMRASAARLVMQPPSIEDFLHAVETVVRANARWVPGYNKGSFYVRPLLIGTSPVLGVAPAQEYLFLVFGSPVGQYMGGDRVIVLHDVHRAAPHGIGAAKTGGNYAASLFPQQIAKRQGYVDVLYLDAQENCYVEELSGANFFAVLRDGTLVTPRLGSILAGVTRDSVLTIARELFGWNAVERRVWIGQVVEDAVEAFYVGTAAVVGSITTVHYEGEDHPIGDGKPGPRTQQLRDALNRIQLQEQPDLWNWVKVVNEQA
jgi:branched-chain amino acid aminotransferase